MLKKVGVAILGFGEEGVATYQTLVNHREFYIKTQRVDLTVEMVFDKSTERVTAQGIPEENCACSIEEVIANPTVDIVVETVGDVETARAFVSAALREGKTVVASNKELICKYLQELEELARRTGCGLYYGASCVGGIPVLRTLLDGVQANYVQKIMCIMANESEVDSAYQLSILSSLAFHAQVPYTAIACENTTAIAEKDIAYAAELGYALKTLAIAKKSEKGIEVRVSPTFVSANNPLSSVKSCNSAVYITGDTMEEITLLGKGAGALPTASALVSDVIYAATHSEVKYSTDKQLTEKEVAFVEDYESAYYLRLSVNDEVGALSKITNILAKYKISIVNIAQKKDEACISLAIVTNYTRESVINKVIEKINELELVSVGACVRVEE